MRFCKLILCIVLLLPSLLRAQRTNGTITGIVRDSVFAQANGNGRVAGAAITLMQQRDSSLVAFTMTDTSGAFRLDRIAAGNYRLLITHTAYRSWSKRITITPDTPAVALTNIYINHRSVQLGEVVIEDEAPPVTLKGDTLEFNAGSFRTAPNASSEEMMRKMPGFVVNSDGTYTVNGQKVTKVLVDGKEFFSDDPALAGRNIPASSVNKVQVFQKASDTEQATGVRDGSSETTINITLKDDKKTGGFGSFMAGAGTNNRYKSAMNYNRFNKDQRVSILANTNNINERAFSMQDVINLSSGFSQGGGGMRSLISDESGSGFGGQPSGINTAWAAGLNFNDDFGKKITFSGSYFFTRRSRDQFSTSVRNYALPDSVFTRNSSAQLNNYTDNHRFNFNTEFRIDSLTKLRVRTGFSYTNNRSYSFTNFSTNAASGAISNSGSNGNFSGRDAFSFNSEITFTRKMHRKGRSLTVNWKANERQGNSFSEPENATTFFTENAPAFSRIVRQRNRQFENRDDQTLLTTWTEPLGRNSRLLFTVEGGTRSARNDRNVYAVDSLDGYLLNFLPDLSNDFTLTFRHLSGGMRFNAEKGKSNITAGLSVRRSELFGLSGTTATGSKTTFVNVLPFVRYAYNFTKYKRFETYYSVDISPPDAGDLNPVKDVSDPLNVIAGNAALGPEVAHELSARFMAPDPGGVHSYFLNVGYTHTENAIITSTSLDSLGRQYSTPINGRPSDGGLIQAHYFPQLTKLRSKIEFGSTYSIDRTWSKVNGADNENRNIALNGSLGWRFEPTDSLELSLSSSINLSEGRYSLRPQQNGRFVSQSYSTTLLWQTKPGITFESSFAYTIATNQATGVQTRFPLWTAAASWQFLKEKKGELKLTVFDILNTNTGIEQNVESTYVEVKRFNTLNRYAMLSFTYKLGQQMNMPKGSRRMMLH